MFTWVGLYLTIPVFSRTLTIPGNFPGESDFQDVQKSSFPQGVFQARRNSATCHTVRIEPSIGWLVDTQIALSCQSSSKVWNCGD